MPLEQIEVGATVSLAGYTYAEARVASFFHDPKAKSALIDQVSLTALLAASFDAGVQRATDDAYLDRAGGNEG